MSFTRDRFVEVRDYVYHNTSRANFPHIVSTMRLDSAALILDGFDRSREIYVRRVGKLSFATSPQSLQSQRPLIEKNIAFEAGWTMANLLERLNTLVFFWPGKERDPIQKGLDHRVSADGPGVDTITLRVPTRDAFTIGDPLFCKYNSGSPRQTSGRRSPRGPGTFDTEMDFNGTSSEVSEVVFKDKFELPFSSQVFDRQTVLWKSIRQMQTAHEWQAEVGVSPV